MIVYELTHVFYQFERELVASPKSLGLFHSYESAQEAIRLFQTKPGFCDNMDAFSIRRRSVLGAIQDRMVFEAIVYFHSEDYAFEYSVELGLFGNKGAAEEAVATYYNDNTSLIHVQNLVVEKIVNECTIGKMEWVEGFDVYAYG